MDEQKVIQKLNKNIKLYEPAAVQMFSGMKG